LCRSAVLYDGELDGKNWRFGTSGWLYQSNKLMYDLDTKSLWHALTGEPVIGPLAHSGLRLSVLPVTTTTWEEWRSAHPDTRVLSVDTGFRRSYRHYTDPQSAYYEYFADPGLMFPAFQLDDRLRPKDQVLALRFDGHAKAYLLESLASAGVLNDSFAGRDLVIVTEKHSRAARAYDRGSHVFRSGASSRELVDETGAVWRVQENELVRTRSAEASSGAPGDHSAGTSGDQLPRLPGHTAYWFGWRSFFPETELYR
jgi:hypothetical protein